LGGKKQKYYFLSSIQVQVQVHLLEIKHDITDFTYELHNKFPNPDTNTVYMDINYIFFNIITVMGVKLRLSTNITL